MIKILADFLQYLEGVHPAIMILGLFLILCLDAMLVPTLPEVFVMTLYMVDPSVGWGLVLLATVVLAELTGNGILYLVAKRGLLPKFFQKALRKWAGLLIVKTERIILVNRAAPILPFVGAMIVLQKWDPRKSFLFIFAGGALKYAFLLAFVGVFYQVFSGETAQNVTVSMIGAVIIVSIAQSYFAKKKHLGPVATRIAHFHEAVPAAAAAPDGEEKGKPRSGGHEQ
jgi:hypothetical protein